MNTQLSKQLSAVLLLLLAITICPHKINAQTWQWGKRGGGIGEPQNVAEDLNSMTADKFGNIYVLSHVWAPYINIDGHSFAGYGSADIAITSWSCNGTLRWAKVIGTPYADNGLGIGVDTLGGVYVTGYIVTSYDSVHISTDSAFYTNALYKNLFLVKYDTGGNYKWFRMPESDTVSTYGQNYTNAVGLDVDGGGNVTLLTRLAPGAYANGSFIVNNKGFYLLRYSGTGAFQGGTDLHLGYKGYPYLLGKMRMAHDRRHGRIYLGGTLDQYSNDTLYFNGTTINRSTYLARFDEQGNTLWVKQSTTGEPAIVGQIDVNDAGSVFVAGYGYTGDQFNGFTVTTGNGSGMPIALAIDSNGNNIWTREAQCNAGTSGSGMVLNSSGEVVMYGTYPGSMSWSGYNKVFNHAWNTGADIYVVRFNAQTGAVNGMDSIASNFGADEFADAATVDKHGNVYVGGELTSTMYVNHDTLSKIGGYTDWFVAKYGFNNCNCTMPIASFGYSAAATNVQFSYGGSSPVDSVRWTFGDGSSSTQQSPTHNYATSGNYTACLTVYNSCGHTDTCRTIQVSAGVNNINALANVLVYPNPVQDQLTVETSANYHAVMMTIDGREVAQQELIAPRTQINTSNLTPGIYLLQLTDANGQRGVLKIVKQ